MKHPTEAAIRLADGKVFVGNFHGHALEEAADAGYSDEILEVAELGFSHSDGTAFYQAQTIPLGQPIPPGGVPGTPLSAPESQMT